jgi:hypothetical protein
MANIIGNNPQDWAANQVKLRQHLLGRQNRTPEILAWQTNKTAWIRAISSVQVDEVKALELSGRQNMGGGKLAQEYVLFNGTVGLEKQTDPKDSNAITYNQKTNAGVYDGPNPQTGTNSSAYGFEYESSRGLVPMPGIEDLSITTYNRGSLRRASFKIKAYNRKQFAILDALFMRPGFTLLLEWGHTTYFKGTPENPVYTTANFNTSPFLMMNNFLENNKAGSQSELLSAIQRERGNGKNGDGTTTEKDDVRGSNGNYDGFYGKIVNFVWSLNSDGSYNIEIKAISTGDIIESLTIDRVESDVDPKPKKIQATTKKTTSKPNENPQVTITVERSNGGASFQHTFSSLTEAKKHREWWKYQYQMKSDGSGLNLVAGSEEFKEFNALKELGFNSTLSYFTIQPPANTVAQEPEGEDILIVSKDKSRLNKFLFDKYNYLKKNFDSLKKDKFTNSLNNKTIPTFNTFGQIEDYGGLLMIQPKVNLEVKDYTGATLYGADKASQNAPYQYILLRNLLTFIQDELLIYSGKDKDGTSIIEENILNFDLDGQNYMYTQPTQFSSDPNVCLIPFVFPTSKVSTSTKEDDEGKKVETEEITFGELVSYYGEVLEGCNFKYSDPDGKIKSEYVANILNIPVNLHYIGKVLNQVTYNNSVPLLKFLEQILYGIQVALGSINKFSVTYNHDENTVVFRDDIPLDPLVATRTKVDKEERTFFNVNGWKPKDENASFVKNVSITTTLSNKFATMISIGAQSQKSSDVANSTSFSRWNAGLTDSVTPSKLSKAGNQSEENEVDKPFKLFSKSITSLNKPEALIPSFYQSSRMPTGDVQTTAQSLNSNLNKYITTVEDKNKLFNPKASNDASPKLEPAVNYNPPSSQGFIPFSMNLDMDGFSGLRIYEKFYVTEEILPPSYPNTLSFLCKGITHTINNSGWVTKIDSLAVTSVDNILPERKPVADITVKDRSIKEPVEETDRAVDTSFTYDATQSVRKITPEQSKNVKIIAQKLKEAGITREGAKGLIGNLLYESRLKPDIVEKVKADAGYVTSAKIGGLGGIGIAQWTGQGKKRRGKLEAAAGGSITKRNNIDFQADYLVTELKTSYNGVFNKLKSSTSIEESTIFVLEKFEVPGSYIESYKVGDQASIKKYNQTKQNRINGALQVSKDVDEVYG